MARPRNTTVDSKPFDATTVEKVWAKAKEDPGYTIFKKDVCGATIRRDAYGKTDTYGWEIDHIQPVAEGGTDALTNLQPLHWENNRHKGDTWPWSPSSCKKKS